LSYGRIAEAPAAAGACEGGNNYSTGPGKARFALPGRGATAPGWRSPAR